MEQFKGLIFCTFLFILASMNASNIEASKQFTVGDHIGWQQPSDNNTAVYTEWAISKRFHVGDSITFEYVNDSVLMVEKWDYYHCNTIKPVYSFDDGDTVINLDRPGLFYFISGVLDHCKKGQRLMIQVMGLHQRDGSPPPATIENTPEIDSAPGPHRSSGVVVTVTLTTVFLTLIVTVVALVVRGRGKESDKSSDENEGPLP